MIVDKAIYRDGRRQGCGDLSNELESLRRDEAGFLWIGLKDPVDDEFDLVNEELHLHPLAVEDAVHGHQRAKIEKYESSVFVVLKTLRYIEATSDIETGEVMVFIGDRFVVTVRHGDGNPLAGVRQRLEADPERLEHGPMTVLHAVMDSVVDNYLVVDREVRRDLEEIEEQVFGSDNGGEANTIYRLKREVLEFRRASQPIADDLTTFMERGRGHGIPDGLLPLPDRIRDLFHFAHQGRRPAAAFLELADLAGELVLFFFEPLQVRQRVAPRAIQRCELIPIDRHAARRHALFYAL